MFNYLKWHLSFIKFCSPSLIGDIIGAVSNFITPGVGLAISAGANLLGSAMSGNAAQDAANTQAQAGAAAQQQLLGIGKNVSGMYTPYQQTGQLGLNNLNQMANSGYLSNQFNNQDLNANLAPNYAFQLQQGQLGNEQTNNATGGIVGGNAQKALQDYTQNYAGTAYQNAFNNYQTQRGNINAMNMSGAQLGLAGATGSANAQLGTATNVASLGIGAANATAASQIAQGNIYGGVANTAGNMLGYSALNSMNQTNPNLGGGAAYGQSSAIQGQNAMFQDTGAGTTTNSFGQTINNNLALG